MPDTLVMLCTCPDAAVAEDLARALVEARLAACVNVLPEIRSIYAWQGEVQSESEVLLVIKTTGPAFSRVKALIEERHPYEVPEILALPVERLSPQYRSWLLASVDVPE